MPLLPPVDRQRLHVREITYAGFLRADGLVDIEAHLVDRKDSDYRLATGLRSKDQPVHEMWARVTINQRFDVIDIDACTDEMPYPQACDRIGPAYKALIGCNLLKGFRKAVSERMGGVHGCTHISELLSSLPTAAVQTFAGIRRETDSVDGKRPFQLDGCHALATDGDTVKRFYPQWYVAAQALPDALPA